MTMALVDALLWFSVLWFARVTGDNMVSSVAGSSVQLACRTSSTSLVASDGIPRWQFEASHASTSRDIPSDTSSRIRTMSDGSLLINYIRFPDDNGTWTCYSARHGARLNSVVLRVLVPPSVSVPSISPNNVHIVDFSREMWTFTCIAHSAYPPVQLNWVKVKINGTSTTSSTSDYIILTPSFTTSRSQTVSTSRKLILSTRVANDQFECQARHVTFDGHVYSRSVALSPRTTVDTQRRHTAGQGQRNDQGLQSVDVVIIIIVLSAVCLLCGILAVTHYGRQRLVVSTALTTLIIGDHEHDLRNKVQGQPDLAGAGQMLLNNGQICVQANWPTSDTEERNQHMTDVARQHQSIFYRQCHTMTRRIRSWRTNTRWRFVACFGLIFVVMTSLALSIPVYLKGVLLPNVETDDVIVLTAGSGLWLDCSELARPLESIVYIMWHRNSDVIYSQERCDQTGDVIGVEANSSVGWSMRQRITWKSFGQVTIWPVLPSENGIYQCTVYIVQDDTGRTAVGRKTTSVFILTGPVTNGPLLALLSIALVTLVLLLAFIVRKNITYHDESSPADLQSDIRR